MENSTLTVDEIREARQVSEIPSFMYVWHDDTGVITGICNYPSHSGYLEVPKSRLTDFLSGKRDYSRYNIEYFKFDEALDIKDRPTEISNSLIYEIPIVNDRGLVDCTIIHNSEDKHWEIELSESSKSMIRQINPSTVFEFNLTLKSDPHFLYKTIIISVSQLLGSKTLKFESEIEHDVDSFTIATFGYFKSYGLLAV